MHTTTLRDIEGADYATSHALAGAVLTVTLTGNLDADAFLPLQSFFASLHREAVAARVRRVHVDLEALRFINSSCLKVLVTWINRLCESPGGDRYTIRFLTNPTRHWQLRSLSPLQSMARELVTIDARAMLDISGPFFTGKTAIAGDMWTVAFTGNLDADAMVVLGNFFVSLHREAAAAHVACVEVQLHELLFINSSCLKVLVTWISQVRDAPGRDRYMIRFLTNPSRQWQRKSLHPIQCLAQDIISIDSDAR